MGSENRNKIALIVLTGLGLLALLIYFGFNGRSYTWYEHYRPNRKDPYGTFLVHELMKDYFPEGDFELLRDSIPSADSLGNYIFIGNEFWMDSLKMERLLHFVEAGNDAFIAANYIPEKLLDTIAGHECAELIYVPDSLYEEDLDLEHYYFQDTSVSLNLIHENLKGKKEYGFTFRFKDEPEEYQWQYLPGELFCEHRTNLVSLGKINGEETNFAKAYYGKGQFFFHNTPIAFTNIYMLKKPGLEYTERVFSHLEPRPIYWDRIRRRWGDGGGGSGRAGNLFADSPLQYILSQPALKWAWYTLLGMAFLYLVFKAKRRQRIIPVLEKNENTSLEFISTIGRLHFIENNHLELSKQKMKLFLGYVRERYHMPTKELNEQFEKQLIARSEVPEEVVKKIFTIHRNIKSSRFTSENVLVDLHQVMAQFYQKCK